MLGLIETDDIEKSLRVVDTFEPPRISPAQMARLGRRADPRLRPGQAAAAARPRSCGSPASATRWGATGAPIGYHYDAGNDFFALFLDPSMTYSCAYFKGGAQTLEEAQQAKLELVCTKLALTGGRAGARRRLRLGELRHPRGHALRRVRCSG